MTAELPYFKCHPSQWLTGDISFEQFATKGAYWDLANFYWSKGCKITLDQMKRVTKGQHKFILASGVVKIVNGEPKINFLDEQYNDRAKQHKQRVENGRKGGFQKHNKTIDPYLNLAPEVIKALNND